MVADTECGFASYGASGSAPLHQLLELATHSEQLGDGVVSIDLARALRLPACLCSLEGKQQTTRLRELAPTVVECVEA